MTSSINRAVVVMAVPMLMLLGRSQAYAAVAALVRIGARVEFLKKDSGPHPRAASITISKSPA